MALVDTKTAEDLYALLQRLYGRTYGSTDESSIFQRRLQAWAVLLATGRADCDRAFRNAYPHMADELISEWELALNLPNDSARTLAQRQARLAAHERTNRGAAREQLQATLDASEIFGEFVANRRDEVLMAGSEDAAILQTTLQMSNEDFYDPILRQAFETLYGNSLPAKHTGAIDRLGFGQSTVVEVGAKWNSATHFLGRDAIGRQVAVPRTEFQPRARVRGFGPGSRLNADDLNRIQETMFGCPLTLEPGMLDFSAVSAGIETFWFGVRLFDGAAVNMDASMDWRDRMVLAIFAFSRDGAGTRRSIVPGQADDDKWGDVANGGDGDTDVSQGIAYTYVYTGAGGDGTTQHTGFWYTGTVGASPSIAIYSTAGGNITALSDGDDFSVCGVIFVTPDLGKA